jgi:hypothetical protein
VAKEVSSATSIRPASIKAALLDAALVPVVQNLRQHAFCNCSWRLFPYRAAACYTSGRACSARKQSGLLRTCS